MRPEMFMKMIGLLLAVATCASSRVLPGIEVLLADSLHLVKGLQLGLVTNQTGVDARGRSSIDLLATHSDVNLVRLFAPEHGLDGSRPAGEIILNEVHPATGLLVTSLYHGSRTINPDLLAGVDALLFDIQDVGVRPYTYVSTMAEVMKAAGRAGLPVIILDRPNPLGGDLVSGLTLDPDWASFIGPFPTPYVHGMTVAELARLFRAEFGVSCSLTVVPMRGWQRSMTFADTGLPWIPTSPHVPTWETAWALAAVGAIGELATLSEGVGTTTPFFLAGGPKTDPEPLMELLQQEGPAGLRTMVWTWIPAYGTWAGQRCVGIRLLPDMRVLPDPCLVQLTLLHGFHREMGDRLFQTRGAKLGMFDKAMGGDRTRLLLQSGADIRSLTQLMQQDALAFRTLRTAHLLYPEGK